MTTEITPATETVAITFLRDSKTGVYTSMCRAYTIVKLTTPAGKYINHELRFNGAPVMQGRMDGLKAAAQRHADGSFEVEAEIGGCVADLDPDAGKTDEEVLAEANKRADAALKLARMTALGKLNLCVITGPGGIGKTYPTERMLEELNRTGEVTSYRAASGTMSAVVLMQYLWDTRMKGGVLLLDDCDVKDPEALNILKAATDSKRNRWITYGKASKVLADAGVDNEFEYQGSIIVISNVDMASKAERSPHMDAILSRGIHMDMGINTKRALALRVGFMIRKMEMLAQEFAAAGEAELYEQGKEEIACYIEQNRDSFRSLTLREATKIAKVYLACGGDSEWAELMTLSLTSVNG